MVPSRFFLLDRLPLTANGKVDRGALPKVDGRRPELATPYVEPATRMELELADIWRDLLHLDKVGVADNLFDLGAQSIHVVQAHSRLKSLVNAGLSIVTIFQYPTIGSLAKYLTSSGESLLSENIQTRAERQRAVRAQQLTRRKSNNV